MGVFNPISAAATDRTIAVTVYKSAPMPDELVEGLEEQKQRFIDKFGREQRIASNEVIQFLR